MSHPFAGLKPESLWNAFYGITQVPRPSKHEERISAHIEAWAGEHGFKVLKDAIGNLVVKVPASPGKESAKPVVIQGHLDMVCEKNKDTEHIKKASTMAARPMVNDTGMLWPINSLTVQSLY